MRLNAASRWPPRSSGPSLLICHIGNGRSGVLGPGPSPGGSPPPLALGGPLAWNLTAMVHLGALQRPSP